MMHFFRSIPYHIKAAFKSIFRHLAMSLSASSAVTVTLVLMSCFLLLAGNISNFTRNIEESVKIHVKVSPVKSEEETLELGEEFEKITGVAHVEYSDKDEEFAKFIEYIKSTGGTPSFYAQYEGENNPLRNAYIIEVSEPENIETIREKLLKIDGVETAEYGGASANDMIKAFDSMRAGGIVFIAALSLLAIFLISNTIKITIFARKDEIAIMRNVGAANWFIKTPFMIEGMIIGFMGAVIPVIFTYYGYEFLFELMGGMLFSEMFPLLPVWPFAKNVCAILIATGMAVGFFGSFFSVNKYLRWKR